MTPETILSLCEYSHSAYDSVPAGMEALDDGQTKARGFACRTVGGGLIAFAGSESILDWLTDFDCVQRRYDAGAIHRGFLTEFEKVWFQISKIFRGVPIHYPIQVTGHSLGGAISCEAARELSKTLGADITHVTFGAPRIYDADLAADFNKLVPNSLRIQHHDDLVPRVPKVNYKHAGKLLRIDDDGKEIRFSGIRGTIERWFEVAKADLEGSAESDHKIDNYLRAVRKWYARNSN